ncbi:hypothetical protein [Endozoicomonas sp. ONNA2]|uniref:hypothetical protein n=1 Tax=Endozoicomonas sp. ONNA2 TaxID=2828741 RepID=UPI0021493591|nr:hypothetical protein [Endozoicomonas sp. ONNA2]
MISCSASCRGTSQHINSQETRPSLSNTEKAVKYGVHGIMMLNFGLATVLAIDKIQSHFNQPAKDFVNDYCFGNVTTVAAYNAREEYKQLLLKDQEVSTLFCKSVISGAIIIASNIFYNVGSRFFCFPNTTNQPTHRPSAEEPNNEQSAMV